MIHGNYPSFEAGLNITLPVRNRAAEANNATAQLNEREQEVQYRQKQNTILLNVRQALITLEQDRAAIAAAQEARVYAQQSYDDSVKKLQLGSTNAFTVVQKEQLLTAAEGVELRDRVNLIEAELTFNQAMGRTLEVHNITLADAPERAHPARPNIPGTPDPEQRRLGIQIAKTQWRATKSAGLEASGSPGPRENCRTPSASGKRKRWSLRSRNRPIVLPISPPSQAIPSGDFTPKPISPIGMPSAILGFPASLPTRAGFIRAMYRERLWTMRQFAGFGTRRGHQSPLPLSAVAGADGLSVAFDLPTLMGYDSDHPLAEGEVGKCGVAISSLADMEALFDRFRWRMSPPR